MSNKKKANKPAPLEPTEQDLKDIEDMNAEPDGKPVPFYPILKVWREVLKPAAEVGEQRIEPHWAVAICGMYSQMTFADMEDFRSRYFAKIETLREILQKQIDSDEDSLKPETPAEDREHNSAAYKQVITDWQIAFVEWDIEWDPSSPHAAAEHAAMSEVYKMFFADDALISYLDNIKMEFTDDDRQNLQVALDTAKAGR